MTELDVDSTRVRRYVYRHFAEHGVAPTVEQVGALVGDAGAGRAALQRLHEDHTIVMSDDGNSIRMALPFSGVPTDYIVRSGGRSWFANCAWDSLGIPAALSIDAVVESQWSDTGDPLHLEVADGSLLQTSGFVGFAVPARSWWDDIVYT